MRTTRPWQVVWIDFGTPVGHEQAGRRPAVVVGSDLHCRFPIGMTIVVPVTTRGRRLPHHVPVTSAEAGLNQPSWVRTDDIRAVSTDRLVGPPMGRLTEAEANAVRHWLGKLIAF